MNTYTRKTLLASMVGLFAAGGASGSLAQGGEAATEQGRIDEIIVTANRRAESLNDAALSIAAIGGEEISRRNLTEMNDYLRTLPGVNMIDVGVGQNAVLIRGVASSPRTEGEISGTTVGVYFGEVSLGGLSSHGGNADLKMIDLERVEVLRGPQGTLYGSSALAGAVRNIPKAPNLENFHGNIKTGYSNTGGFGGDNTKIEGVVNIPLIDNVLAIRAVAYHHDTSGYIKNIAGTLLATNGAINDNGARAADAVTAFGSAEFYQDENNIGQATYTGGRIAALWKPTEELSVTLHYITQDVEQKGRAYEQLALGAYTQYAQQFGNNVEAVGNRDQGHLDEISITNLVAEYDLGWATLLSSSAWLEEDGERNDELSYVISGSPVVQLYSSFADAFIQEFRLVSQLEGPLQYVAGAYYEDTEYFFNAPDYETGDLALSLFAASPINPPGPLLFDQFFDKAQDQLSIYGELSYEFTDQWTLTGGFRHFDYERTQHYFLTGAFGEVDSRGGIEESGTNYKINVSYEPNDNTLLYAQWSEGFRLGNAVTQPPPSSCDANNDGILDGTNSPIRDSFDSDTSENFELGAKLTLLDNRLQINAAVYQIDWQDIPLSVTGGLDQDPRVCFSSIQTNAGEARSQGVEIETVYQLTEGFRISLGGAYTNAELTSVVPGVSFLPGDRLPGAPEYSANLGLEYEFEVEGYASYVRSDYAYVSDFFPAAGEAFGGIGSDPLAAGDYGQLNLSAGIDIESFKIELFANNLTDDDGFIYTAGIGRGEVYRLRPRTIGLNIGYEF